ncbi:bifunctional UDP-N-acetylglucosamine diphosphorylase/glucosamine-1-phosphate N-acetyltransferase GlmU [Xylanibacillus composti]|uniref:Bifunctional protein GlmU n=1 Tax=Xylanibacillus composti TaxID=1572762 RepID=A0A8J4H0D5_9BACL|nr:bifunctional UDP-N-acetylglucosamine diphosphorylase/glucosamine-1-phosphate N-acetyltransferase GlmU [Xylanibacillus composti]MDT9725151.1 bifunctional UDP-N-acetylglucosamine diphosphorylase/glucosamine-1-phosphate N-acetyltransferase GlmU [Xylanibacillus composti]GIQ67276.1 bifunctional protein GlmU [Xylanibacillus composti]
MNVYGLVLAAGQGKRMKSKLYKVLHPVCGVPMVGHVVNLLESMQTAQNIVIVGHGAEAVQAYLGDRVSYALQAEQLGTGHAVQQAASLLADKEGITVVICGDTPLITKESLDEMIARHQQRGASATILSAQLPDPTGYGRIIRGKDESVLRIVEQKDCSPEEAAICEINTGTYCFDNRKLFEMLPKLTNQNAQGEYYLTDVIGLLQQAGEKVEAYCLKDAAEATGVNDRIALAEVERAMRQRIIEEHMRKGVTVIDPANTYIGPDVEIGADTILYPGVHLTGQTVIGEDCEIGPNCQIDQSRIEAGVHITQSVLKQAEVQTGASIGPFAYLRPGAQIGPQAKIGDFVEVKNARIGAGSKVSHLSYVGDADIGQDVNVGCGAITVNYDGFAKHRTIVEDGAFVGSNVNLIAPVHVGKGAYVVAGSTITHDVDAGDLAIARERQTNKPGYAAKLKSRIQSRNQSQN